MVDGVANKENVADRDSLGVCVDDRDRCSQYRGVVCSLTGKTLCYEFRDR